MKMPLKGTVCAVILYAVSASAAATSDEVNPEQTREALSILLAAYGTKVQLNSSCDGAFSATQKGAARIGDVFAYRLSYLSDGTNVVSGQCDGKPERQACRVSLTHANGEDVASTTIQFRAVKGKLAPASLMCVITP